MRVLFVSSSLPNSLTIENQILAKEEQVFTKKIVSKTFASSSQVKSPILSKPSHHPLTLDQSNLKQSAPPKRTRSHSTTSQKTSISLLNSEEHFMQNLRLEESQMKTIWKFTEMPGHAALATASSLNQDVEKLFIGWPGPIKNEQENEIEFQDLAPEIIEQIKSLYKKETDSIPVFLDSASNKGHASYCNKALWPIFHYSVWDNASQCKEILRDWQNYVKVNEAFAEKILEVYKVGDLIWILDHQLLLLPELLRQKLQRAPIGFYLRTTFPSSELFRCLPQAEELLRGMLGANLIGFNAYAYARHFTSCCTRVLGLEASLQRIDYEGAPVELAVIPTGIDAKETFETLESPEVKEKFERFVELYNGMAVLVAIDRFNHSKGIVNKLSAYERFLKDHPEWKGKVVLVQVILPDQEISNFSISEIKSSKDLSLITDMAAQINSQYGSIEYVPISIYHQDIELSEYYALLQVADCYISTKERDSLSLVPLDFVICQEKSEKKSPILLSEFTALSGSMSTSLLINPWDHAAVSQAIFKALTISIDEKRFRHEVNKKYNHIIIILIL
jgi:trehalose-6-phosphate synthase